MPIWDAYTVAKSNQTWQGETSIVFFWGFGIDESAGKVARRGYSSISTWKGVEEFSEAASEILAHAIGGSAFGHRWQADIS
tara:strand:- start:2560 stop:2802 length:243 start_codon:yes stop_codon:yes gene_type:complete